ncbi:MAG TPA: TadE family protein [Pyrinomonadaceae bacterium]|nr:TadE family protein [Pyrinomonadaceae bacterium]
MILKSLKDRLRRITQREDGASTIELAIIFPILAILFVGTAELGRMFYYYTTLAKATNVGARYLSTSRNAVNGTADEKTEARNEARNLVVCGIKSTSSTACDGQTPVIPGLTTANVLICDNFSTPCSPVLAGGSVKYFKVQISGYTYAAGVFNLASKTSLGSSTFYFPLQPGTETRWMQ